jgi:hypothetical protein
MKASVWLIFFTVLLLSVTGCQKDELTKSKTEILTAGSWRVSSYKINQEEIALMDCQKDNYMSFNADGSYTDYVGSLKCEISESDITGTWILSDDGVTLTLESLQGIQNAAAEITENKLVLTFTDDTDIIIVTCVPI